MWTLGIDLESVAVHRTVALPVQQRDNLEHPNQPFLGLLPP